MSWIGSFSWIEKDFLDAQCATKSGTAPVVIRRLNRQEYDNTIRDLLGIDLKLSESFPADEIGFGFDNVGSALNMSPIHVEKYLEAAERALEAAIVPPDSEGMPPIELIGLRTYPLTRAEPVAFEHSLKPGLYMADFSLVRVGIAESAPTPRLVIGFGTDRRAVEAVQGSGRNSCLPILVKCGGRGSAGAGRARGKGAGSAGPRWPWRRSPRTSAATNATVRIVACTSIRWSYAVPSRKTKRICQPRIVASWFGPLATETTRGIECAREVVERFVDRAFRRPARAEEVDRVMAIFALAHDRGESFERAIQVALTTVLVSPRFLYLVEPEEGDRESPA